MCGRASHSARSATLTAEYFHSRLQFQLPSTTINGSTTHNDSNNKAAVPIHDITNSNTSPGSTTQIFRNNPFNKTIIECTPMTWGIPQHHSKNKLMFNARSESIYTKPSFLHLINNEQTCIWAIDGYYEWKDKQPYYICRRDNTPMLLAGLWRDESRDSKTFTILTMNAINSNMEWLHPRQPVILWDVDTAVRWLLSPNQALKDSICSIPENALSMEDTLHYYPVTKRVGDTKYRGRDCTKEIKLGNLKSFFACATDGEVSSKSKADHTPAQKEQEVKTESWKRQYKTEGLVVDKQQQKKPRVDPNHSLRSIDKPWACQVCTFEHTGESIQFLACEMCGSKRHTSSSGYDVAPEESTDGSISRVWGSSSK